MAKRWWESKTIWANALTTAVGVIGVVMGSDWIAEYPQVASILVMVVGVLNVVLRTITDKPVK